jgi:hypothetical protein
MSQQYPQDPQQPQQPPQYQPAPPPKKKHTLRNVFLVIMLLGVLAIGGCVALAGGISNEIDKQANTEHTVVYKVTGTSKAASLTYTTDGSTTTEQVASAKLPWTKTLKIKGLIPVYQISAQNGIGQKGTVVCTIEVDGKAVKTATGTGEASIASCDYSPSS